MQRRFSVSTAILIVLLLGVLYAVGRVVNPPTKAEHDHDEAAASKEAQAAKGQSPDPKARPKTEAQQEEMMRHKMMQARTDDKPVAEGKAGAKPVAKAAPKGMSVSAHTAPDGMDPSLWQEHDMGTVTIKPDAKK